MSTLLFGVGRQGYRILELLIEEGISPIHIYDINNEILEFAKSKFGSNIEIISNNPFKKEEKDFLKFIKDFSLIIDALPAAESFYLLKNAAISGVNVVSVSFLEEDFLKLHNDAENSGSIIIPDCGAAPGFSHMMAGYSANKLENPGKVVMKLGAVPQIPNAPFFHSFTWSIDDLMEEYIRPAKIVESGDIEYVNPFLTIKQENIFDIDFQSFITDGVRSFSDSFPNIPYIEERTLRYFGHLDFMKTLDEAGLLTKETVNINGNDIVPFKVLSKTMEKSFSNLPKEDMFIMEIAVENRKERHTHLYKMDYDAKSNTFGLVNAVAVSALESAKFILNNKVKKPGVFPLEQLATEELFTQMANAHRKYGAIVKLTTTTL